MEFIKSEVLPPMASVDGSPAAYEVATMKSSTPQAEQLLAGGTDSIEYLRQQVAIFRATFEQAAVGIAHVAPDGRWLRVNHRLCTIIGYAEAELLTKTFQELTYADDLLADLTQVTRMLAGDIQTYTMRKRYWHKQGHLIWANLTVSLIYDRGGAPDYFVAMVEDITALQQAEETLRASEERLRLALDAARMATFEYNAVTQTVQRSSNALFVQGLGEQGIGGEYYAYVHPAERAQLQSIIEHMTPAENTYEFEYRFIRPDNGITIWLLDRAQAFFDGQGQLQRITGVVLDITERKQATEALRHQRDFLQLVIDHVPNLIVVKDIEGRFQLVNEYAAQRFGLQTAQMIGKMDAEINPNLEEVAFFRQKDAETLAHNQPVFIPEERVMGGYYQTSKIPLRNHGTVPDRLLIVSVDIMERKRTEAALQQALQKEKELSDLKSSFVTTASHEFRTPLAIILALTETLVAYRHKLTDAKIQQRLLQIQNQVMRLKGMMTDVLELARLNAHTIHFAPARVNPDTLCRDVLAELESLLIVTQRLSYSCEAGLPELYLDERLLRHILSSLISNAIKYSAADKTVFVNLVYTGETLVLTVRDEGIGIPFDDQKHIFQPFYRAANVGTIAGTGLGLSITKEYIELHGGTITLESKVDTGTTFTISLPVIRGGETVT